MPWQDDYDNDELGTVPDQGERDDEYQDRLDADRDTDESEEK